MSDARKEIVFSRVLVTGANGMLGQELVKRLSELDQYDVLATGRDDKPRFTIGSCGYVPMDITNHRLVRNICDDFEPDVIVNCAAMTQVDQCEEDRDLCWKVNVDAVENLAGICRAKGTRLVQVSTDFVFNGADGPYMETDRPDALNYYGKSKLAAENAVRLVGDDRWAIVRTILVFGAPQNPTRSNIALWVINELSQGKSIRVVTDQFRTPTYAPDLANGIERIIRFVKSGIFHLSGTDLMSVYDFSILIADVLGLDKSLISPTDASEFSQPAKRPPKTGFIILKAQTELGFSPLPIKKAISHLGKRLGISVPS